MSIDNAPSPVQPGATASVSLAVTNKGTATGSTYARTEVELHISGNTTWGDADDITVADVFGCGTNSNMTPGQTVNLSCVISVPPNAAPGFYWLMGMVDPRDRMQELMEDSDNRTRYSTPIQIGSLPGILDITIYDANDIRAPGIEVELLNGAQSVAKGTTDSQGTVSFVTVDPTWSVTAHVRTPVPNSEFWAVCGPYVVAANARRSEACVRQEPWIGHVSANGQDMAVLPTITSDGKPIDVTITVRGRAAVARNVELILNATTTGGEWYASGVRLAATLPARPNAAQYSEATLTYQLRVPAGTKTLMSLLLDLHSEIGTQVRTDIAPSDANVFVVRSGNDATYLLRPVTDLSSVRSSNPDVILVHGYMLTGCSTLTDPVSGNVGNLYWGVESSSVAGGEPTTDWLRLRADLERNGTRVWTYRWCPHESIEAAGNNLREMILRDGRMANRLVLVGHSMGGLVSIQAMTSGTGLRGRVERLLTLGTPLDGINVGELQGFCASRSVSCDEINWNFSFGYPSYLQTLHSKRTANDEGVIRIIGSYLPRFGDVFYSFGWCFANIGNGYVGDCVVPLVSALGERSFPRTSVIAPTGPALHPNISSHGFNGYDHGDIKWDWRKTLPPTYDGGRELESVLYKLLLADFGGSPAGTLAIRHQGSGSGRVVSSPSGIDCDGTSGRNCSTSFSDGAQVALTALGTPGTIFTGWLGACTPDESRREVCTAEARQGVHSTVTASFTASTKVRTLTVEPRGNGQGRITSSPSGLVCSEPAAALDDCKVYFEDGETITLWSSPAAGSVTGPWSGACLPGIGSCTAWMGSDRSVGATFAGPGLAFELRVHIQGSGGGLVASQPGGIACVKPSSPAGCVDDMDAGSSVVLTAIAAPGSAFTGWSGACAPDGNQCTVVMGSSRDVVARFALAATARTLRMTLDGLGSGTISSSPSGISCTLQPSGLATGPCTALFDIDEVVHVFADFAAGSRFARWRHACIPNGNTCMTWMSVDRLIGADFDPGSAPPSTNADGLLTLELVADALFGRIRLTPHQLEHVDGLGNGNGRLDVGDVLGWLQSRRAVGAAQFDETLSIHKEERK